MIRRTLYTAAILWLAFTGFAMTIAYLTNPPITAAGVMDGE